MENIFLKFIKRYETWLIYRIDGASLSLFRILFGTFISVDGVYFWLNRRVYFPERKIYFKYPGFEFWPNATATQNEFALILLILSGLWIIIGKSSKFGFLLTSIILVHFFLFDASFYLNHLAMELLLAFACAWLPMDRYYVWRTKSLDSVRTVARYELLTVIGIYCACYVFSAIEKIRPEWMMGDILAINMGLRAEHSTIANWIYSHPQFIRLGAWSSWAIELLMPFGILWKRTRAMTVALLAVFHVLNHLTLNIGLFSFLMFAGMVLYFDPAWPNRFIHFRKA